MATSQKTHPDDVEIILAYQKGKQAETQILQRYAKLVWKEVHRSQRIARGLIEDEELYQIATIALLRVAATWNPNLNPSFLSYASFVIRRELTKAKQTALSQKTTCFSDIQKSLKQNQHVEVMDDFNLSNEFWRTWHDASCKLTLLERIVLSLKLALDGGRKVSFRKIAQDLKLTSEQVRNTYYRGLVKLRRRLRNLLE